MIAQTKVQSTISSTASVNIIIIVTVIVGAFVVLAAVIIRRRIRSKGSNVSRFTNDLRLSMAEAGQRATSTSKQDVVAAFNVPIRLLQGQAANGNSSRDGSPDVFNIAFEELTLEDTPFARGGGGEVFRGDYSGNCIAAKKVFNTSTSGADFQREISTLARLSHPCIMALYGVSTDPAGIPEMSRHMFVVCVVCCAKT